MQSIVVLLSCAIKECATRPILFVKMFLHVALFHLFVSPAFFQVSTLKSKVTQKQNNHRGLPFLLRFWIFFLRLE